MENKYFSIKKAEEVLTLLRGKQALIEIVKATGEERIMEGTIGWSESQHGFLLNEELDSSLPPLFKKLPLSRVKRINIGGRDIRPLTPKKYLLKALSPKPVFQKEEVLA